MLSFHITFHLFCFQNECIRHWVVNTHTHTHTHTYIAYTYTQNDYTQAFDIVYKAYIYLFITFPCYLNINLNV